MNYIKLNMKSLLILSSITVAFINPINAYDSESDNIYGKDDFSFGKQKKEKDNKKESNKYYRSKTYNLNKKYSDDYYDKLENNDFERSKEKQIKNRDLKTLYKKQNKLDSYNSGGNKYFLTEKENEKSPHKSQYNSSSDLSDSDDTKYNNKHAPTKFIGPYKQHKKECVGKNCDKNEPKFSSYVYSSSSSMVSNGDGTWIKQNKYDMTEDNNRKQERRQFSKGDSKSGVVNTKYKKLALDKKSNKKVEQKDEWKEEFSDYMQGKHKNRKRLISSSEEE